MAILVKEQQSANASAIISVTLSGMIIPPCKPAAAAISVVLSFVYRILFSLQYTVFALSTVRCIKPAQLPKARPPISVTRAGITTCVKAVHKINASQPISVTESGITMFVREVQQLNADQSILVTLSGSSIRVKELQQKNIFQLISVILSGIVTLVKELHSLKTPPPIFVTLFGITTCVKPVQPENTSSPISVTLSGRTRLPTNFFLSATEISVPSLMFSSLRFVFSSAVNGNSSTLAISSLLVAGISHSITNKFKKNL